MHIRHMCAWHAAHQWNLKNSRWMIQYKTSAYYMYLSQITRIWIDGRCFICDVSDVTKPQTNQSVVNNWHPVDIQGYVGCLDDWWYPVKQDGLGEEVGNQIHYWNEHLHRVTVLCKRKWVKLFYFIYLFIFLHSTSMKSTNNEFYIINEEYYK